MKEIIERIGSAGVEQEIGIETGTLPFILSKDAVGLSGRFAFACLLNVTDEETGEIKNQSVIAIDTEEKTVFVLSTSDIMYSTVSQLSKAFERRNMSLSERAVKIERKETRNGNAYSSVCLA